MPALTEAQELQSGSKLTSLAPGLPHKIPDLCMYEWAQNMKTQDWTKEFNLLVSVRGKKGGWKAEVCLMQTNNPASRGQWVERFLPECVVFFWMFLNGNFCEVKSFFSPSYLNSARALWVQTEIVQQSFSFFWWQFKLEHQWHGILCRYWRVY